jgi:hypothetical protein
MYLSRQKTGRAGIFWEAGSACIGKNKDNEFDVDVTLVLLMDF